MDLVHRLRDYVQFDGRRVLYTWIGGTRRDWRGQGFFRALTEQQELWAIEQGFDEIVVKTKNKFYDMRGTLDHLRFEVVKYERNAADNAESKVYLSKKLLPEMVRTHRSEKAVVRHQPKGSLGSGSAESGARSQLRSSACRDPNLQPLVLRPFKPFSRRPRPIDMCARHI